MARKPAKVRYLLYRDGRYFARKVVPARLRPIVGVRELLEPLGADRADALHRLHAAVAKFNVILANAERGLPPPPPAVSIPHAVHDLYRAELHQDDFERYAGIPGGGPEIYNSLFAGAYLHSLRKLAGGFVSDYEIKEGFVEATIGWAIEDATRGKERPARGTKAWLNLAKALASAKIEAIERSRERDTGDFKGTPAYEPLTGPPPKPELETAPVSIDGLLERYVAMLARTRRGTEAARRWRPCFRNLVAFLEHDDARLITKSDLQRWVEHLRSMLAEKTIKDVYLGSVKAVLSYAAEQDWIESNPAQLVKIRLGRREQGREQGFTNAEASALLKASRGYTPKPSTNKATREGAHLVEAKRWVPLLCALTGARVAEITQLRKEDALEQDGIPFIRLTPDAGSMKTGKYRDVPLHRQIIEQGFLEFVSASPAGPLFFRENPNRKGSTHPSKTVAGRISQWVRSLGIVGDTVDPSHGWRHRFKTVGREAGIDGRVLDAIQGHAPRTAGDSYGDVTLRTKAMQIKNIENMPILPRE